MSANVWYEEVNRGLMTEIRNSVKCKNANGVLTAIDASAVTVRSPEKEFKSEVYPCVSIYNRDSRLDLVRNNTEPVVVSRDTVNKQMVIEDPAIPYFLEIQIDFWAKYQKDINDIVRTWLMKHSRQFNLSVVDDGNVSRNCNCMKKGNVVVSDLFSGGERLYHRIIIYQIWVELDDETRYNKPMVVDRSIATEYDSDNESSN